MFPPFLIRVDSLNDTMGIVIAYKDAPCWRLLKRAYDTSFMGLLYCFVEIFLDYGTSVLLYSIDVWKALPFSMCLGYQKIQMFPIMSTTFFNVPRHALGLYRGPLLGSRANQWECRIMSFGVSSLLPTHQLRPQVRSSSALVHT